MTKNLIIVGICILFIGVIVALLFHPAPKPQLIGDLTPSQENELRASLAVERDRGDSLQMELGKSKSAGKVAETVFKKEIGGLKKEIAKGKASPVVIQLVQETPALDSLHQAYDSAMVAYEGRIFSLTNELQQRDTINAQIQDNFERRLAASGQLLADKEAEVVQLQGENKKLRRRLFWTKVAGVVILGGIVAISL
jgi:hypothetical protein